MFKKGTFLAAFYRFLAAFLLPALELAFIRIWMRAGLALRPGLPGFVDYDLLLPVPLSFFALLYLTGDREKARISLSALGLNLACLGALLSFLLWRWSSAPHVFGAAFHFPFWTLLALLLVSGSQVFYPTLRVLRGSSKVLLGSTLLASLSIVLFKNVYHSDWHFFARLSANSACSVLQLLDSASSCDWRGQNFLLVRYQSIRAFIGSTCAGWDALLVSLAGATVFTTHHSKRLGIFSMVLLFGTSTVFAFALNTARIVLLLTASAFWGHLVEGPTSANRAVSALFHAHVGWILYCLGFAAFFLAWKFLLEYFTAHEPVSSKSTHPHHPLQQ